VDTAAKTEQRNPYVLNENQRKNQASQQKSEAVQSSAIPEDEVKKLQVATVYYNMGDLSMAKSLLKELEHSSFNKIKNDAKALLREIDR
jgi:FimV-like protein